MTLIEAIEVKRTYHNCNSQHMTPEERDADNMSIEALEAIIHSRRMWSDRGIGTLSGETKG